MEIRYGKRRDLKQAAVLLNESWRWAYKDIFDAAYLASMSDRGRYKKLLKGYRSGKRPLLLYDGDELLGFCGFGASMTPGYPEDGEIGAIYLREDAAGKGYGHALFAKAEEELYAQGYRNLVLDVLSQNERAIKFYLAHGFVKVQDRQWKGYPMDIMRKEAL